MPNPYGAAEVSPTEVAQLRQAKPGHYLLVDVREPFECELAAIPGRDVILVPLSDLSARGLEALPEEMQGRDRPLIVFCHHGIRSAQVTLWLQNQGWLDVRSMEGGIDLYAQQVDPSVGAYE